MRAGVCVRTWQGKHRCVFLNLLGKCTLTPTLLPPVPPPPPPPGTALWEFSKPREPSRRAVRGPLCKGGRCGFPSARSRHEELGTRGPGAASLRQRTQRPFLSAPDSKAASSSARSWSGDRVILRSHPGFATVQL